MDKTALRRRIVAEVFRKSFPRRLTKFDVAYTTAVLAIGFGLGARIVGQTVRALTPLESVQGYYLSPVPEETPTPTPDPRVTKLQGFLKSHLSPLAPYAEFIVKQADIYDIGWTTLASISGMESDYGKNIPDGSYNAWGLGGSNFMYFSSWMESITYASKLIGNHYKRNEIEAIQEKYCPHSDNCNPDWVDVVHGASKAILTMKGGE